MSITSADVEQPWITCCEEHGHQWEDRQDAMRCHRCGKVRLTVQVEQQGNPVGEYVCMVPGQTAEEAVAYFMQRARIDLKFRFLTGYGYVNLERTES